MKTGDKVTFTGAEPVGGKLRMVTREGKVKSLNPDADFAFVEFSDGINEIKPIGRLRKQADA